MGLEKISILKKKKGFTSKQLSDISGVPIGTLNKILNGQTKNPAYETISALAKALDCSVDIFCDNNILKNNKESILLEHYNKLNDLGKDEAIKRVSELTEINKYTEFEEINTLEDLNPELIAAHDDDLTADEKAEADKRILEAIKKMKK